MVQSIKGHSFDTQLPRLSATLYEQSIISYKKVFSKYADLQKIRDVLKCGARLQSVQLKQV